MKSEDALVTAWSETLPRKGAAPAIFDRHGEVLRTFSGIEDRARELENSLTRFKSGDVVAIQLGNHVDWPSVLLACLRRELVVVPLERTMNERERDVALEICGAAGVAAVVLGGSSYEILPLKTAAATTKTSTTRHVWGQERPSLLKLTSGTTAAPRAIRFRSEQLLADCVQICETMGITDSDLNFAVIPVSHSYGFSNLITPLIARAVPMALSNDPMPRAILDDLARSRATVFPGMPVFYQAFCEVNHLPDLNRLRLCISAGAPLPLEIARKFREKSTRPIHSFYGCSECGGICYDRDGTTLEQGFVGEPMRGVDLEFLEPNATSSRIRVRSEAVGDGYFPDAEDEKLGKGSFVPDDLLSKSRNGFCIVGRVSDIINVAGKKVNPAEVEAELLRFEGVEEAVVFGRESALRNEEVAACVVASAGLQEAELLEFCRRRLSGWQVPKRIFVVEQIPVNERGKTSRRELAQRFAAGGA